MNISDWIFDKRTECWSAMTLMTVTDYIRMVDEAHAKQGALTGQRSVLTTTTAKRIRERMISDIEMGAVLPPVVIGCVIETSQFDSIEPEEPRPEINELLPQDASGLSIIDGMQRTSAIKEALEKFPRIGDQPIRVEFWFAREVRALIYRMLVLNTGQVPWTMDRQLTVVYAPLLSAIESNVQGLEKISTPDNRVRRVGPGQYSAANILEMYIAFSLRKTAVDTKEAVSDEFSRLDFVDNLAEQAFQDQFYAVMNMLVSLDKAISRFEGFSDTTEKLSRGVQVFSSQPACIGFIVAIATKILGRPGADKSNEAREENTKRLLMRHEHLVERLNKMSQTELGGFLKLDVLTEVLDKRVGQVGRYERSVFSEAFKVLIEEDFELRTLEPCWRAN